MRNRVKWSIAVLNYVCMSEVMVGRKPSLHLLSLTFDCMLALLLLPSDGLMLHVLNKLVEIDFLILSRVKNYAEQNLWESRRKQL